MAVWTRRDVLRLSTVVIAGGVGAGCVSTVGGTPRALPHGSDDGPDPVPKRDLVRIAVLGDNEPDSYKDESGQITGQVPEVARAVLDRLGVSKVELVLVDVPDKALVMLTAGQVDLLGGLVVRPEACEGVDFSPPDHILRDALLVPTGNPKGLKSFTDVAATGARIAVTTGSTGREKAQRAGVAPSQIVEFGFAEMIPAVAAGAVDCGYYLETVLRALAADEAAVEVTPGFVPAGEQPVIIAFGYAKGSDLAGDFDAALLDLQESGEWLRISKRFGYDDKDLADEDVSIEKACAG